MLGLRGFQPPWASTSLHDPQQPPKSSTMLVFDLPGLRAPLTTPEIERDARFWGFRPPWASTSLGFDLPRPPPKSSVMLGLGGLSTFLGFDNPRQPPKLSAMLGFGGFRPPWASTSLHDPRQPLKSSTMLGFGGFRPHYCIIDCRYAPAIYYFLCLLFCAISDESHLNNQNSVLFCTTLDQLHSTLYCPMPDL